MQTRSLLHRITQNIIWVHSNPTQWINGERVHYQQLSHDQTASKPELEQTVPTINARDACNHCHRARQKYIPKHGGFYAGTHSKTLANMRSVYSMFSMDPLVC